MRLLQGRLVELDSTADAYDLSTKKWPPRSFIRVSYETKPDAGGQSTVELEAEEYETSGGLSLALCRLAVWPCAPPFRGRPLCGGGCAACKGLFACAPVAVSFSACGPLVENRELLGVRQSIGLSSLIAIIDNHYRQPLPLTTG